VKKAEHVYGLTLLGDCVTFNEKTLFEAYIVSRVIDVVLQVSFCSATVEVDFS